MPYIIGNKKDKNFLMYGLRNTEFQYYYYGNDSKVIS